VTAPQCCCWVSALWLACAELSECCPLQPRSASDAVLMWQFLRATVISLIHMHTGSSSTVRELVPAPMLLPTAASNSFICTGTGTHPLICSDPLSCNRYNTACMLQQQHIIMRTAYVLFVVHATVTCALPAGSPPHERALPGQLVNAASGCGGGACTPTAAAAAAAQQQ
jgi:hypothetical protein